MPKKITQAEIDHVWDTYEAFHGVTTPTKDEVTRGVKKLLRGKNIAIKFVTGRNTTRFISMNQLNINLTQGWRAIVTSCAWRLSPSGWVEPSAELKLVKRVCQNDWLVGALQPVVKPKEKPSKDEVRAGKIERLEARMLAWMKKQARADAAIVKINRSLTALRRYV